MQRKLRIFLCHASQDKPAIRELYKQLKSEIWIDPWLDEESLLAGQKWAVEIPQIVREADIVLVCLSNNSITKEGYVQKEITLALDIADEKPEETIYIIPVRLEDCRVPARLNKWHWIDLFEIKGFDGLKKSLIKRADGLRVNYKYPKYIEKDIGFLADYVTTLRENDKNKTNGWENSPFEWIINLPPGQKGRIGKLLVEKWCSEKGFHFEKTSDSESDLIINGFRFSIKFSTLWSNGIYKFQQIRNTGYDFIICFGISPEEAHCWVIKRDDLILNGYLMLSTENSNYSEMRWITVNPHKNDDWISEFGGDLEKAYQVLKRNLS